MPGISRRVFLRNASLGAAAVGTVAVVGPSAFGLASSGAAAAPLASDRLTAATATHASSGAAGAEVMAHVVDHSSGTIAVYSGTKMVTFQNRQVADALLRAAR